MLKNQYAVVRNRGNNDFRFTQLYKDYEEAKTEAERLCLKEKDEFFIIRIISKCTLSTVVWEE